MTKNKEARHLNKEPVAVKHELGKSDFAVDRSDLETKARELAKAFYAGKKRLSGKPLFDHVSSVVSLLKEIKVSDPVILSLAYLHHAYEEVGESVVSVIAKKVSPEVAELVLRYQELRVSHIKKVNPQEENVGMVIATYFNVVKDSGLLLVRLADKVDDVESLVSLPKDIRVSKAERVLGLYAPICHLLGLGLFVRLLEDGAFKVVDPKKYSQIESHVNRLKPRIEELVFKQEPFIDELLTEAGVKNLKIVTRIKHLYSVHKKLLNHALKNKTIHQVFDIAAMMVLVETVEDCYLVEQALNSLWENVLEERSDYIKVPKVSGYKALHTVYKADADLNFEVQVKTVEMHENNEYGFASHAYYKLGSGIREFFSKNTDFLKAFSAVGEEGLCVGTETGALAEASSEVYVFTPKGKIIELPKGSCLVDFAYAVHDDIGNHCTGGYINGKIAKLVTELKSGDVVEIITGGIGSKPSKDWLGFVKTTKAAKNIRKFESGI